MEILILSKELIFENLTNYRKLLFPWILFPHRVTSGAAQREKCPYSEFFWSAFSRAGKYGSEKLRIRTFFMQCRALADCWRSTHCSVFSDFLINKCPCSMKLLLAIRHVYFKFKFINSKESFQRKVERINTPLSSTFFFETVCTISWFMLIILWLCD